MRRDMKKVIYDKPRHQPRFNDCTYRPVRAKVRQLMREEKYDELMPFESRGFEYRRMNAGHRGKGRTKNKNFTDHLNPLRRCLKKHVGKSWNDLYSEICSVTDLRNHPDQHFRSRGYGRTSGHLFDTVALAPTSHFKRTWDRSEKKCQIELSYYKELYVDENWILRETPEEFRYLRWYERHNKTSKEEPTFVEVSKNIFCNLVNGIWYFVEKRQKFRKFPNRWNVLKKDGTIVTVSHSPLRMKNVESYIVVGYKLEPDEFEYVRVKQLNKKELKRYKLFNWRKK